MRRRRPRPGWVSKRNHPTSTPTTRRGRPGERRGCARAFGGCAGTDGRTCGNSTGVEGTGGGAVSGSARAATPLGAGAPVRVGHRCVPTEGTSRTHSPTATRIGRGPSRPGGRRRTTRPTRSREKDGRKTGEGERKCGVRGGDARSAVDTDVSGGIRTEAGESTGQRSGGQQTPCRIEVVGGRCAHRTRDVARAWIYRFDLAAVPLCRPHVQQQAGRRQLGGPVRGQDGQLPAGQHHVARLGGVGRIRGRLPQREVSASPRREAAVEQPHIPQPSPAQQATTRGRRTGRSDHRARRRSHPLADPSVELPPAGRRSSAADASPRSGRRAGRVRCRGRRRSSRGCAHAERPNARRARRATSAHRAPGPAHRWPAGSPVRRP